MRLALLLLFALAAPARAQDPAAEAAAGIGRAASAFSRALEAGDAATMAAQYTDDATLIPPNGALVTGREAILAFWTPRNPDFRTTRHNLATDRLEVAGDVAIEVGTWTQEGGAKDAEPTSSSGRYLVVWRRGADGVWRMQFDSWTRPFPPPAGG